LRINVRPASTGDAETISALNAEVQALHHAQMPWRFKPPGQESFSPAAAAKLLAKPENLLFLGEIDDGPAGYIYGEIIERPETPFTLAFSQIYIHHICVASAFRGSGLGAAMIAVVENAAAARGIGQVALDVWSFNASARVFFARAGYTPYIERLWRQVTRVSQSESD